MLLSDTLTKRVFKEVLKNRTVLFKELLESLNKNKELVNVENPQIEGVVKKLQDANLIKERTTPIKDFNT
jgi:hypothetical protein